ncbi:Uncharacterised protein [Halioglobus japonicus]|nr:Uncharacterised protein [Halioglobus japonicus]
MHKEDEERLSREANIAFAVRGPDYSQVEQAISRNKAKARSQFNLQRETDAKQRIPPTPRGIDEDTRRRQAITREHEQRRRYAASQIRTPSL